MADAAQSGQRALVGSQNFSVAASAAPRIDSRRPYFTDTTCQ